MPRDRSGRTYRVRRLPSHVSKDGVACLLSETRKALGDASNIVVFSLASSLVPFETPRLQTATVMFKSLPEILNNDDNEWTLTTADGQPSIIIDTHFLGFTALNDAESDLHTVDGLASHPFGSWADRNLQSNFMWFRDLLPQDIKHVRSIIYGYDTRLVQSESFQTIHDIALTLIAQLRLIGRALKSAKPAVILAHSLGGILLKHALLEMANSGEVENFMLKSIRQVILFGVPNKGMDMAHWLPMVEGRPNEPLIHLLSPGSPELIELDERFKGIAMHFSLRIISFYETERSKTAAKNPSTQKWEMSGPLKVLVNRDSAIQSGSHKSDILPINKSHSDMVKFREGTVDYQLVASRIHDLVTAISNESRTHGPLDDIQGSQKVEYSSLNDNDDNIQELKRSIIRSLDIEDTKYRLEKIEDAYGSTFEWIWTRPNVGFLAWLEHGHGIYWISGKPGSGKSTLMKYVFKDYQERGPKRSFSPDRLHLCAGFFFYDRGSHLQKSFEGLLFSILHQILRLEPRLIQHVTPIYLKRSQKQRLAPWPVEDLEEALNSILNQTTLSIDLLLFLDALDEYGGKPEYIAAFAKHLIDPTRDSATKIRLCFSSRPWNVFTDQFQTFPGLRVHEQTEQDIVAYITGKFEESPSMTSLRQAEDEEGHSNFELLISGLIRGAEGVFLWLKLVIEDLLNDCTEGATMAELQETLASFPSELEALYTRTVQRIPRKFGRESYAMLEIILRSRTPISPYDFWLAAACAPCKSLEECVAKIPLKPYLAANQRYIVHPNYPVGEMAGTFDDELEKPFGISEQEQRRLKSRCGGLVELVTRADSHHNPGGYIIQFMHQTVKDFISKPGSRQLLIDENDNSVENGYSFLSKYGLAQLVLERRRYHIPNYCPLPVFAPKLPSWFNYTLYFSKAESSTGVSQKHLLDAAREAFAPLVDKDDVYGLFGSPMLFGVANNLQLYVKETLRTTDGTLLARFLGHTDQDNMSLLHMVVIKATSDSSRFLPKRLFRKRSRPSRRVDYGMASDIAYIHPDDLTPMAEMLLVHGANKSAVYQSLSPFQWLFQMCGEGYGGVNNTIPISVLNLTRAFLLHGQDPNALIWNDFHYEDRRSQCMPLHVADSHLAAILLEHGANINALDSQGRTALDIAFGAAGNIYEIGDHVTPEEGYRLPILLLDHGGCVTDAVMVALERYLKAIVRYKPLEMLDRRIQNPPRLTSSRYSIFRLFQRS